MAHNKRRVAILGAGYISDWHLKALRGLSGVEVVAVCDLNRARADDFARKHGLASSYGSFEEMHAAERVDVVHVLTPAERHFAAALPIVEAGVHVLLEKPLATNVEDCDALIAAARARGVRVGVSHNFLFAEVYERLKSDIDAGALGKVDHVDVVWCKELGQLTAGRFQLWMLRDPGNIILELGSHSLAHLLHLIGAPEALRVQTSNPIEHPSGVSYPRRWQVDAQHGSMLARVLIALNPGFTEHSIHVRGSLASATVDFEKNTYVRHEHSPHNLDVDRFAMTAAEGSSLRRQAWGNLVRTVVSKATKSPRGNPFGASIAASLRCFYERLDEESDPRNAATFGRDVIALCGQVIAQAALPAAPERPATAVASDAGTRAQPTVLVLGATGFIGREVVRQLTERGVTSRVLTRGAGGAGAGFDPRFVEVVSGDASDPAALDVAMNGVAQVIHLARATVKTWAEYQKHDVEVTRLIAQKVLEHKVKRLIYASSIAAYYAGAQAGVITEETPLDPKIERRNVYARAKAAAERMLVEMGTRDKLPVVIVRPGVVLGRGCAPYHSGVGFWSWNAICQFWGRGDNPLPVVLNEDVAAGLVAMLDAPGIDGESFNLVAATGLTARQYVEEMEHCSGLRFRKWPTPIMKYYLTDMAKWLVKMLVRHPERRMPSYRDWETRSQRATYDCRKARERLGWKPESDPRAVIKRGIHEPMRDSIR